jgi:hypothetical protein
MFGFAIQKQEQTGPESWAGVWNLETGQEMRQIKLPWPDVQAIALNPDGSTFVCARSAFDANAVPQEWVMEVAAWKVKTGKEQFKFKTSGGPVTGATYSPDGRILLVSTQSSLLWIADTETGGGRKLLPVAQGFGTFGALSFAPDGHTFAIAVQHNDPSGSIASKILVFEAASQSLRQEFSGHAAPINSLTYSADGKTLGSTSNDTTALLWDLTGIDPDKPPSDKLDRKELDALWEKLNEPIASDAFAALVRLASAPGDTTAFLREHLKPADGTERPSEEQIAKWIKNLDNDDFTAREQASADLARAGKLAEAQLKKAQDSNPSTETAVRIKRLLENIESFDEAKIILRPMRALEVLERIGTAEAREVVDNLSGGNGDAALTRAAKAALQRMR